MCAFVPTTALSAISGAPVRRQSATNGLRAGARPASRAPRMVAYPYTGTGYGGAGVPYGGAQPGVGFAETTTKTIVDTAASVPVFKTLVKLLVETGLDYELSKGGPFTVFAPTDGAFASLLEPHSFSLLGSLLRPENGEELKKILSYHVVRGNISSSAIIAAGKLTGETLAGVPLTTMGYNKRVTAGSALIVKADVPCSNGVIHAISSVLVPPSFTVQPRGPAVPVFPASQILDVYANTLTPRQALGIDPLPAGADGGALTK